MKRIILTVTTDLTYDQRMIRIATALSDAGYGVTLVGREKEESLPLVSRDYQQVRLSCKYEKGKLFYLEYNYLLFKYLMNQKADLICAIDLDTIFPVYLATKKNNIPFVFDAHEYFEEVPEVVNRPMIKKIWSSLASFCVPKCDAAYTVSNGLVEIFSDKYNIPFELIRNVPISNDDVNKQNIDTAVVDKIKELANNYKIVLYQGVLNEGRGLPEVVEAMTYLPDDIVLVLAGDGDIGTALHAQVARAYLHDKVIFLGYQQPETLRAITPFATVGLNLLENRGLSYYYSLANKTFDYIRASVPALHPNFPEYRFLLKEHEIGVLINSLDAIHLAAVIEELSKDQARLEYYRDNCRLAKKVHTWENESIKLVDLYDRILQPEMMR